MNPIINLNKLLLTLNPFEFTVLSTILGFIFSNGLNDLEVQSIGNFFESIGQTMITIGTQQQNLANYSTINQAEYINILKNKIPDIENIISNIKNLNF